MSIRSGSRDGADMEGLERFRLKDLDELLLGQFQDGQQGDHGALHERAVSTRDGTMSVEFVSAHHSKFVDAF